MARDLAEQRGHPRRAASMLDIFSCVVQGLIPWGAQALLLGSIFALSPLSVVSMSFYPMALALAALVAVFIERQVAAAPIIDKSPDHHLLPLRPGAGRHSRGVRQAPTALRWPSRRRRPKQLHLAGDYPVVPGQIPAQSLPRFSSRWPLVKVTQPFSSTTGAPMSDTQPERQSLRQLIRQRRKSLSQAEQQAAAQQLVTRFQEHPRDPGGQTHRPLPGQ